MNEVTLPSFDILYDVSEFWSNENPKHEQLYLELVSVDGACGSTLLAYAAYAVANC
jgi:hypothetical protein